MSNETTLSEFTEKESQSSVFGDVPEDWSVSNLNNSSLFDSTSSGLEEFSGDRIYVPTGGVEGGEIVSDDGHISYDSRPSRANLEVEARDVLFAKMKDSVKVLRANERLSENFVFSTGFVRIRPSNRVNSELLKQVLLSNKFNQSKDSLAIGSTQPAIRISDLSALNIPIPPIEEQRKVATVLYTVDRAIEKTKDIIHQAKTVRGGLRRSAFESGIDETGKFRDLSKSMFQKTRIGNIPKSWDFLRLDEVCSDVVDCLNTTPEYSDSGIRVILTSEIEDGRYDPEESPYVTEEVYKERIRRIEPEPGDVIFTREAPIGEAFKIPEGERLCLGQRTIQLRPKNNELNSDFLLELLYSEKLQSWFQRVAVGSTTKHMRVGDVEGMKIPVPDIEEQRRIASLLGSYRDYITTNMEYVDKLRRFKQGLQQDLLSGKVRTTDTNIEVPDEIAQHG